MKQTELSIVVPAFNEAENIAPLHEAVTKALKGKSYELILIDDGSNDDTYDAMRKAQQSDPKVVIVRLRGNSGQTAAMDAGIKNSKGRYIVTMDADLQNDPQDIPLLLKNLEENGLDVVSGWRADRKDPIGKRIASKIANGIRRLITGEKIHDSGCTLKAFRRECFDGLDLFGEMHRYIPALLLWRGCRIGEIKVRHHPRLRGKTKYGLRRIMRGFLDLIVVKFWMRYSTRPIHLFGGLGIIMALAGFAIGAYLTVMKIVYKVGLSDRPLLLLAVLLIVLGAQSLMFGVLADILVKIYFKGNPSYIVAEVRRR